MHGDDSALDEFQRKLQECFQRVAEHNTQIEKLWNELHGLRETLENMTERDTHR